MLINLMAAIGFGGLLGGFIGAWGQSVFQHQKELKEDLHKLKRARYGAILILMITILYPKSGLARVRERRPDLNDLNDCKEEVKTEMLNGVLFANDDVIKGMADFARKWTSDAFFRTVSAMRKDLWGKNTQIDENILSDLGPGEA